MIKKGDVTRNSILETAKGLFSEKGYSAVTMQDFCERNELSRGGLYRHFASTKEIFIAMLDCDKENSSIGLEEAISAQIPARQMISQFINNKRQEIQFCGDRLSLAIYEFCSTDIDQKEYIKNRFASAPDPLPNCYTNSPIPWISFTGFTLQSYKPSEYYFPTVEAGRYFERDNLTIIDMQIMPFIWKDYGGKAIYKEENLIANTKQLIEKARNTDTPIYYVMYTETGDSLRAEGQPLWQVHPEIAPEVKAN